MRGVKGEEVMDESDAVLLLFTWGVNVCKE